MEQSSSQEMEDLDFECESIYSTEDEDEQEDSEEEEEEDIQDYFNRSCSDGEEDNDSKKHGDKPCWSEFQDRKASFSYSGSGGFRSPLPPDVTPIDIFRLFIDDDILDYIVTETNRYAFQSSRQWKPIDKEELLKYLGLVMWMGLVKLGQLSDYWSSDEIYNNSVAPNTMPRIRFQNILRNIHFANNEDIESIDRLGKVQPLIDKLQANYQKIYTPEEDIVIDESLVPWRGRLSFKQYIPGKAHKYGIKIYKLCSVDGYCWSLQVYGGSNPTTKGREMSQPLKVCKSLTEGLRNEGRTLYVDNFYTSYPLAKFFLKEKTHVVGTLKANRANMPKEVFEKKLNKGEMISREEQHGILVLKWRDTRDVRMLSTKHKPEMKSVTSGLSTKMKPTAVLDYNKGKVGIDLSDQMGSYASSHRKGLKWYRKLSVELLLGVSVVNASILYKKVTKSRISIREFREKIVSSLLGLSRKRKNNIPFVKTNVHCLSLSLNSRRTCVVCYAKTKKEFGRVIASRTAKKVKTYCESCDRRAFCVPCFANHHSYQ